MIFPLFKRKLIRGFQDHINAGLSGACDYTANKDILYAPFGGKILKFKEDKGGNWIRITRVTGERIEFAHLDRYLIDKTESKAGDKLAITGNTGTQTSGPHLHCQIFNEKQERVDPEKYFSPTNIPVIAINGDIPFMQKLQEKILEYSQGMLTISWDIIDYPIEVASGMLTQEQAYEFSKELYDDKYRPYRYLFMFYKGNPDSVFLATFYNPEQHNCISTIPLGADPRSVAFEFSHAIQKFYNSHRGDLPHVEIIDSNFPSDDLLCAKYRSVLPYTEILLKKI